MCTMVSHFMLMTIALLASAQRIDVAPDIKSDHDVVADTGANYRRVLFIDTIARGTLTMLQYFPWETTLQAAGIEPTEAKLVSTYIDDAVTLASSVNGVITGQCASYSKMVPTVSTILDRVASSSSLPAAVNVSFVVVKGILATLIPILQEKCDSDEKKNDEASGDKHSSTNVSEPADAPSPLSWTTDLENSLKIVGSTTTDVSFRGVVEQIVDSDVTHGLESYMEPMVGFLDAQMTKGTLHAYKHQIVMLARVMGIMEENESQTMPTAHKLEALNLRMRFEGMEALAGTTTTSTVPLSASSPVTTSAPAPAPMSTSASQLAEASASASALVGESEPVSLWDDNRTTFIVVAIAAFVVIALVLLGVCFVCRQKSSPAKKQKRPVESGGVQGSRFAPIADRNARDGRARAPRTPIYSAPVPMDGQDEIWAPEPSSEWYWQNHSTPNVASPDASTHASWSHDTHLEVPKTKKTGERRKSKTKRRRPSTATDKKDSMPRNI